MPVTFDHFLTYSSADDIDDYLKEYAAQGFLPHSDTVRHEPGLRNGFIFFGPEYIEFCWIEDDELFAKADAEEKLLRAALRPFGIGMVSEDIHAVHTDWTARGYSVPDVWSKAPRDADPDAPAVWSFQEIPAELLPGASCFALTYHKRPKGQARHITIPPNTLYAIDGVVFVTAEPEARAVCWRNLLAPDEPVVSCVDRFEVPVGPHRAAWMTPDAYRSTFGFEWVPATHPYGELAVLQLLASEPATAIDTLEQANRHVYPINGEGDDAFLIAPDVRDGFLFSVRQYPVERWMQERSARTGEKLILA